MGTGLSGASESSPQPARRGVRLLYIAIAIIIIIIAITGSASFSPQPRTMEKSQPWLFKGAYADYTGSILVCSSCVLVVPTAIRIEVVDYNSTHVLLRDNMTFTEGKWVPIDDPWPAFFGMEVSRVYESNLSVKGYGERSCKVYEATVGEVTGRVYVDKSTNWLIMMELSLGSLRIAESNIPGLKK